MSDASYIGYIYYVAILLLVTGGLILRVEVKGYEMVEMQKEKKAALFFGWFNVLLGLITLVANWAFQQWFR